MNTERSAVLQAAYTHCRHIARTEAKNFFYAFRVLPPAKSDAMCAVYAFMRKADDLSDDESLSLPERRAAMRAWTEQWRCSRVMPCTDSVFLALRDTQQRFGIGDDLLEQLVAGTTLDLQEQIDGIALLRTSALGDDRTSVQVYTDFSALRRYCYLVASVVGLVCIRIFGYTDQRAEDLAIDTGIAFQLTNILRDVREDAERGRLYLSADVLAQHGLTPEAMLDAALRQQPSPQALAVLQTFEREAQSLYRSAAALIPMLDADARPAMAILAGIYHRLLDRIAENHAAVLHKRVAVPMAEKLTILLEGGIAASQAGPFA